jgi:hypothetical protein
MLQTNRQILVVWWITLLIGCSGEKRITGLYTASNSSPTSFEKIYLEKENIFKITSWSDVAGEFRSIGKWLVKGDTLFLEKYETISNATNYQYSYDPSIKGVSIKVLWRSDSLGNPFSKIFLNAGLTPLDSIGKGKFISSEETIQSVRIYNFGDYVEVPSPRTKANVLVYYWGLADNSSVDIGRTFRIKNSRLYPLERKGYYYRKVK